MDGSEILEGLRSREYRDALAEEIARSTKGEMQIDRLMSVLSDPHGDKHNALKVLERIAELRPELLLDRTEQFAKFLACDAHSDPSATRLMWGSICILDEIATIAPKRIAKHLDAIANVTESNSIVARDHAVFIFAKLSAQKSLRETCIALLLDMVQRSPINQLPSYSETTARVVTSKDEAALLDRAIESRLHEDIPDTKRKRLEKVRKGLKKIAGHV